MKEQTISNLFDYHQEQEAAITILTASTDNPTGYGRIIRDEAGNVLRIVEQKDANEQELLVKEINTGVCCYDNKVLFEALTKITNNNSQGEYYLTSCPISTSVPIYVASGLIIVTPFLICCSFTRFLKTFSA